MVENPTVHGSKVIGGTFVSDTGAVNMVIELYSGQRVRVEGVATPNYSGDVEWDIDANLPMYTRDFLRMIKEGRFEYNLCTYGTETH